MNIYNYIINVVGWLWSITLCMHTHTVCSQSRFPARAADSGNRHAGTQAGFQLALLASTSGISIGLGPGLLTGEYSVSWLPKQDW